MTTKNTEFEIRGINHVALVCRDMARTVDFYQGVLGMPLVKTIELPAGMGQHFFFEIGNGDCVAFFWFPDAPDAAPGIAAPRTRPADGELVSAIGSMNHLAFDVPSEKFDEYYERLLAKGVEVSEPLLHDDSEWGVASEMHPGVFVRSMYFFDPDGILLEFASWERKVGEAADLGVEPRTEGVSQTR
jgi:catechol 2,3-dioxygenase-like lactoylglutathione lyase family enzyme